MSDNGSGKFANFEPHGDGVVQRWERWLRGFENYIVGKNITEAARKKALLLHHGGFALQDIFYAIPGADAVGTDEDAYEKTKKVLTDYFKPKANVTYERFVFRNLKQDPSETIAQYVIRLRQQANYCDFHNVDDAIKDQLIEHCQSEELRRRALEMEEATLDKIGKLALSLEAVGIQSKQMVGENVVARLSQDKKVSTCYSCGRMGHKSFDENCPARTRKCNKCGQVGHFAKVCKENPRKYTSYRGGRRQSSGARYVQEDNADVVDDYAFGITEDCVYSVSAKMAELKVGGISLQFLIDSGASCNIISEEL